MELGKEIDVDALTKGQLRYRETPKNTLESVCMEVMAAEADAILSARLHLRTQFAAACHFIRSLHGKLMVTGVGKAGLIGQKISATLASTGTTSFFLNPLDALHGDLGRLDIHDAVMFLSNSGSTSELLRLLAHVKKVGATTLCVTSDHDSELAKGCDVVVAYGIVDEAGPLRLAPSCSTAVMLSIGDAIALACMTALQFKKADYARVHPGGALAGKAFRVKDVMRTSFAVCGEDEWIKKVLDAMSAAGCGIACIVDDGGRLNGVFTDGDLRRNHAADTKIPVRLKMTSLPQKIHEDAYIGEAMAKMRDCRVNALPVIDTEERPVGIVDIQDIVGLNLEV